METKTSDVTEKRCLLCGGRRQHPVFEESGIDILRCRDCGHVFSAYAGEAHYDGFWSDKVGDREHRYWSGARARMYDDFIRRYVVGRSGRLLDMGCGLGFFLKRMTPYPQWESYGCEISPAAVQYAHQELGLTGVTCTRLEDARLPEGSFDLVTMWDVLDHILNPDPLLQRVRALLRPEGACFIRTPNIVMHLPRARAKQLLGRQRPGVMYLQARDHLHHYSPTSLVRLLQRNGFARIEFLHLPPVDSAGNGNRSLARLGRNGWFQAVRALAAITGGRFNLDNLFVLARK